MASARDRLLGRYRDAATSIADASLTKLASVESSKELEPDALALEELLQRQARVLLARHDAVTKHGEVCPTDAVLLETRLKDLTSISMSKFYAYRYDLLPYYWRQLYSDALILNTHLLVLQLAQGSVSSLESNTILDKVVENLDRALITAGGAGKTLGSKWIETTLVVLEEVYGPNSDTKRPQKRQKTSDEQSKFPADEPNARPKMNHECPRYESWSIDKFETYMNDTKKSPRPIVFTSLISTSWSALTDRPWNSPDYLLSKTFGGRRLVPVEIGRTYVDEGWGQELIQFKDFLERYITTKSGDVGYLAQHNLFQQIPSLRNDICVPDLCWADVPGHPTDPSKNKEPVDVPQLNAWFGPAGTITPLHTDAYHNLLCQAVGTKYVRLYPPDVGEAMQPRQLEDGIDMSNTSALDIGVLEGWDERPEDVSDDDVRRAKERLEGVEYWECILAPGDTLLIPMGWWHYVRSLSISFSVSFWWN